MLKQYSSKRIVTDWKINWNKVESIAQKNYSSKNIYYFIRIGKRPFKNLGSAKTVSKNINNTCTFGKCFVTSGL